MDETTPGDEAGTASEVGVRPLREVRAERLLTLRDLAGLAGEDRAALSEIEAGTRRPTRALVRRVTAALGVEASAIAEFRPRMPARYDEAGDRAAAARLEALGYPSILALRAMNRAKYVGEAT